MTYAAVALTVVLAGLAVVCAWALWLSKARTPASSERTEECEVCAIEIPISRAHLIRSTANDRALGITEGGTGMSASYCAEHCPGVCNHVDTNDNHHRAVGS